MIDSTLLPTSYFQRSETFLIKNKYTILAGTAIVIAAAITLVAIAAFPPAGVPLACMISSSAAAGILTALVLTLIGTGALTKFALDCDFVFNYSKFYDEKIPNEVSGAQNQFQNISVNIPQIEDKMETKSFKNSFKITQLILSGETEIDGEDFQSEQKSPLEPLNKTSLVLFASAIAYGILSLPNFCMGLGLSYRLLSAKAILVGLPAILVTPTGSRLRAHDEITDNNLLSANLLFPVVEELIFRGAVQPLISESISRMIPSARVAVLGPAISRAAAISILAIAALLGFGSAQNRKNNYGQVLATTFGAISHGMIAAKYGPYAAMGAHIASNSIPDALGFFAKKMERQ